jgi:hypothetical protein
MNRPPGPAPSRTALIIYLAMLGAVAIALVMSASLQSLRVFPPGTLAPAFAAIPLAIAAGAVLVFLTVRRRLPERRSGQRADEWWRANLPVAVTLWATAESTALVGAGFYLVTGAPSALAATALGLALLAFSTPSSLSDG